MLSERASSNSTPRRPARRTSPYLSLMEIVHTDLFVETNRRKDYSKEVSTFNNKISREKAASIQNKGDVAGSPMQFFHAVADPPGQHVHLLRADTRKECIRKEVNSEDI